MQSAYGEYSGSFALLIDLLYLVSYHDILVLLRLQVHVLIIDSLSCSLPTLLWRLCAQFVIRISPFLRQPYLLIFFCPLCYKMAHLQIRLGPYHSPGAGMLLCLNTSTQGRLTYISNSLFRIPGSYLILKLGRREPLNLAAMQWLLVVANASISDHLAASSANHYSLLWPFIYDLGDGVEIKLSSSTRPILGLTWGQLQTIVGELWIYHIEGRRNWESDFDICDLEQEYVYPMIGWGTIQKSEKLAAEAASPKTNFKRDYPTTSPELDVVGLARPGYSTSVGLIDEN